MCGAYARSYECALVVYSRGEDLSLFLALSVVEETLQRVECAIGEEGRFVCCKTASWGRASSVSIEFMLLF